MEAAASGSGRMRLVGSSSFGSSVQVWGQESVFTAISRASFFSLVSIALATAFLLFSSSANATFYEVDPETSTVLVYGGFYGGYLGELTVTGHFETEIADDQLSFVNVDLRFSPNNFSIFPDYPATLNGESFTARQVVCHGTMPDLWYEGVIIDKTIVIDGEYHFPVCGNDGFFFEYHIVGRQPRDIPQLQLPGILIFAALILVLGILVQRL